MQGLCSVGASGKDGAENGEGGECRQPLRSKGPLPLANSHPGVGVGDRGLGLQRPGTGFHHHPARTRQQVLPQAFR